MESCDNLMMNTYHFDSNDLLDVKPSPSGWEDDEAWEDETEPTDVVGGMDCPVPQMKVQAHGGHQNLMMVCKRGGITRGYVVANI